MIESNRHYALLQTASSFLFDLDGTLIDSSPCHELAFRTALQANLPSLVESFVYEEHKGKSTRKTFADLGVSDSQLLELLTDKKQILYRQMVEDGALQAFPYAEELLAALLKRGHRAWIVTGASRRSAESALSKLGLIGYFEALVTADEAPETKPAPDLYLKCLKEHGIHANTALALEDAVSGIQSARSAGLNVLAVNNLELSHLPEYVGTIKDLHDLWLLLKK